MFSSPSIILVDDNQQELETIKKSFFEVGMACLPLKYINDDPNINGIDPEKIPSSENLRVIVTDLNLTEAPNPKPVDLVGPLATMLQALDIKGPYILCVWSKLSNLVDDVMELLQTRYHNSCPLPFHYSVISKSELSEDPDALQSKVESLVSENTLFDALLQWEYRVSAAAKRTTNELFSLAKSIDGIDSIDSSLSQLKIILSGIGNEALGIKNASDNPALAVESGLTPVLEDQLRTFSPDNLDEKWRDALPDLGRKLSLNNSIKSKLNTFYHVEEVCGDYPKSGRGIFVSLNKSFVEQDPNKFKNRLGKGESSIINEEFINPIGSKEDKAFRDKARGEIILGFLEVSPVCDHAQRKIKLPRYVLGALIPEEFEKLTYFISGSETPRIRSHEGIYRFPNIKIRNNSFIFKLSFKYQIGAQPDDNKWFGEPIFRVKDQILSAISFNGAQYESRPGLVSFW
jgi:hypothetical protein